MCISVSSFQVLGWSEPEICFLVIDKILCARDLYTIALSRWFYRQDLCIVKRKKCRWVDCCIMAFSPIIFRPVMRIISCPGGTNIVFFKATNLTIRRVVSNRYLFYFGYFIRYYMCKNRFWWLRMRW